MSRTQTTNRIWIATAIAVLTLVAGSVAWLRTWTSAQRSVTSSQQVRGTESQGAEPSATPLVGLANDPFARYGEFPDGYVGTAVCASCHADRHESYLKTHHSRSLREVDLASEPFDQTLVHPPSNRSYDIAVKDGRLWHREWRHLSNAAGDRFQSNQLPVGYVMGSGAFAKGYLLADGDYLLQSPVTWYAGSGKFGMAPSYDSKHHLGFSRMIHDECLFCHAGLVRPRNDNPHHPAIVEMSIGCERCHGGGAEHVQLFRQIESGELKSSAGLDPKIVDPKKLSRTQTESICGQCHLHGDVTVNGPGAELWDFVPGNDFAPTRVHYKSGAPTEFAKAFTGHFDQMWQSACYRNSETLTCVTCHDPHQSEPIADRVAWRREQCNGCHQDSGCGLPLDQRMARGQNDCIKCHMPSLNSEVPHTSTTSHWIAVYDSGKPRSMKSSTGNADSSGTLRRVESSPALSDEELARRDLLGRSFWIENQAKLGELQPLIAFQKRNELSALIRGDRSDAEIHSLLARMAQLIADGTAQTPENRILIDTQCQLATTDAIETLRLEQRPVKTRAAALAVLGSQLMRTGDYADAVECFAELTQIRRAAVDWYHLGLSLARVQRLADAERALREAIRIDATYAKPYRSLSILYRSIDPVASRRFADMAQRLMQP